jgi:hypothetical protein
MLSLLFFSQAGEKKSNQRNALFRPAIIPLPELLRKLAACASLGIWGNNLEAFSQAFPNPNAGLLGFKPNF